MADLSRHSTRFSMRSKQLGQLLLESGSVQAEQVARALKIQEQKGGMLGQVLQEIGACSNQSIAQALLKQVRVTDVKCEELAVPPEVAELVSRETCEAEKLCPFERLGNLLCVVMGNPLNRRAISQIEETNHVKVKSFKSIWPKIHELIQRTYGESEIDEDAELDATISSHEMAPAEAAAALELEKAVKVTGIVEIPPPEFENPVPLAPVARKNRLPERPFEPKIEGIDNLDDAHAEVIQSDKRGLTKSLRGSSDAGDEPSKPKIQKRAIINVDLDALDLSAGEVVEEKTEEGYEEIPATSASKLYSRFAGEIIQLKAVDDAYFFADKAPADGVRSDDLVKAVSALPVAEVVAESIGDYEAKQAARHEEKIKRAEKPVFRASASSFVAAVKDRPVELQPSPATVMTAVLISETEFQKNMSNLGEDPVGEWDWIFIATGPVAVQVYEESN